MMKMKNSMVMKPRDVKEAICEERWYDKTRIAGVALVMGTMASMYQGYFDGLVYRSGQFQAAALAGQKSWRDYDSYNAITTWKDRQNKDVWNDKSFKELKQIEEGWVTMTYENERTRYATPNGNPYDNKGYFTQTVRAYDDGFVDLYNELTEEVVQRDPIERDALKYDNWYDMHNGDIMWFDTSACWEGDFVGEVNNFRA